MSLYEVLVIAALALVGGYAYILYRRDTRPRSPGPEVPETEADVAAGGLMFGRVPKDRAGDGTGPGPRS